MQTDEYICSTYVENLIKRYRAFRVLDENVFERI